MWDLIVSVPNHCLPIFLLCFIYKYVQSPVVCFKFYGDDNGSIPNVERIGLDCDLKRQLIQLYMFLINSDIFCLFSVFKEFNIGII